MREHVASEAEAEVEPARAPAPALAPDRPELARALAASIGNQAFARAVLARNGPPVTPAGPLPADTDWETTPNLRGNHPVRDRHRPPNPNVVEDAGEYAALREQARAALVRQRARADGYLDKHGNLSDYRYFFARVYSYVTENEILFCESNVFYYPAYVLKCVLFFERLYDDNVRAFDTPGGRVEDHWKTAFEATLAAQQRAEAARTVAQLSAGIPGTNALTALNAVTMEVLGAMTALTISMKAHIRYDLPRAESWVFNQDYRHLPGVRQDDFMADFMSMSGVFDRAGEAMLPDMAAKLGVPVDLIPRMVQDTSMAYVFGADMATERADTWRRAVALGDERPNDTGPYSRAPDGGYTGDATSADQMSGIEGLSDPALRPSMEDAMDSGDDDSAHEELDSMSDADLARLPAVRRVQHLRALQSGATIGDDETLILRILRASTADLVIVVDGADAWDLMYSLGGRERASMRALFQTGYYAQTALFTALRLARRCMDGETANWEEEMVADIVVARPDRVALVTQIGAHYSDMNGATDFHRGLNKLEWQLGGGEEDRVHTVLAADPAAPASKSGEWW
jgi:hypothetical protein